MSNICLDGHLASLSISELLGLGMSVKRQEGSPLLKHESGYCLALQATTILLHPVQISRRHKASHVV